VEQLPIIPGYSTWMMEKGFNSEEAQSILSMPSLEFLYGKLGIIEALAIRLIDYGASLAFRSGFIDSK